MMLSPEDLVGKYWADYYRRWHASSEVPEALDREVVGKLRSTDWEREYDAAAELYTRSLFEDLGGLKFAFQPVLQGKTPDFMLWTQFGKGVIADVTVLHNGPISHLEKQQEDYDLLRQKASAIETEHFATNVLSITGTRSVVGMPGGSVALAKILHKVRESSNKLEQRYCKAPNLLTWEPQFIDKVRSATRHLAFPELDISLELEVAFCLKEDQTDEHLTLRDLQRDGKLGVASPYSDDPDRRLRTAIRGKVSYLTRLRHPQSEKDELPYMVIIFDGDSYSIDELDMERVLYGPSVGYDLEPRSLNEELYQWKQRNGLGSAESYGEGLFTSRKSGFLAVLKCTGDIRLPLACEMSMWVNPYASLFGIPQSLFRLKTYSLNRRIDCTPPCRT